MMTRFVLFFLSTVVLFTGCNSKVTTVDPEALEEAEMMAKPAPSSIEALTRQLEEPAETCSSGKNGLRVLATLNQSEPLKCRDNTRRNPALAAGPACPGGVTISNVTASSAWVDCADVQLCGKAPKTKTNLASHPLARMTQLEFSDLPWGCVGDLEWAPADRTGDPKAIQKVPVDFSPPPCPFCTTTGTRTCEVCGTDAVAPVIKEVIADVAGCNKIKVLIFAEDAQSGLHRDAYSIDSGTTWQSSNEFLVTGTTLSLEGSKIRVRDRAGNVTSWIRTVSLTAPPCPCDAPWGEKIPHGETRTSFTSATVTCAQTCQSASRTCNNGVLSGDAAATFANCKVEGCPSCNLPWGGKIEHGESITAYQSANVTCADQCRSALVTCNKGTLTGPAYTASSCKFTKPTCNCEISGAVIPDGGTRQTYAAAEVACGSTCQPQTVSCSLGTLGGATSAKSLSCSPKECKCTTPWGQKIDLNQEVDAFKSSTMTCSSNATCKDPSNWIRIKCNNVQTNELVIVQGSGNIADFKQPACSAPTCTCEHLGVFFKPTDAPLAVYKTETVNPPGTCQTAGNVGSVKCIQVGANFTVQGDTNKSVFKYTSCQSTATGGQSSENVGPGAGGGAGGGIGNSEGEGEGFRRRGKSSKGCNVNEPPYVCAGYIVDMGIAGDSNACVLPGPNGYSGLPADPLNFKGRIEAKGFITAFSRKEVACGDSCARYSQLIFCLATGMSNSTTHPYSDCREVCP